MAKRPQLARLVMMSFMSLVSSQVNAASYANLFGVVFMFLSFSDEHGRLSWVFSKVL